MNITNITVTKTAEEKTENASYVLEYSIVNDEIIYMEQGNISCNLPAGRELGPIFRDFDKMQQYIRESINPKKES